MNRLKLNKIVPAVLLASAAVWVANAADQQPVAAAASNRAYALTFHVNAPSTVPNGAAITCKAVFAPGQSTLEKFIGEAPLAESSTGMGIVTGSSADCTVDVPAGTPARDARNGLIMSYEIVAFTPAGPVFVRTQRGVPVTPQQAGVPANLRLNVNL